MNKLSMKTFFMHKKIAFEKQILNEDSPEYSNKF